MLARAAAVLSPAAPLSVPRRDGWRGTPRRGGLAAGRHRARHLDAGITGLELAARLRRDGSIAAIVFLTVHDEEAFVLAAKAVGALGYVVKQRLQCDLPVAVREAAAGRPFVSARR